MIEFFQSLEKESFDMLLRCIDGHVRGYNKGEENAGDDLIDSGRSDCFLVIDGFVEYFDQNNNKVAVAANNIGLNAKKIGILEESSLLFFNYNKAIDPCWFSCNFHWKFAELLIKQGK